jgi:hypothetical protein
VVTLNGDIADAAAFYHTEKVTVADGGAGPGWLFKDLEEHHHHQADYEPESQVLIKWVQFTIPSMLFSQRLTNLNRQGECGSVGNSVHPGDMRGKERTKSGWI